METIPSDILEYASDLTLLYVEDDELSREITKLNLAGFFKRVIVAVNGEEGLECVRSEQPDIILTDYLMPVMNGLEMLRNLRDAGSTIPVILVTSSIDDTVLTEAINLGVSKFIPKPIDFRPLQEIFRSVAHEIVAKKLHEQNRRQEIELLKYEKRYHSQQQGLALEKETHLLRNDLLGTSMVCGATGSRWFVDIYHRPQDIMCGDGFMVRHRKNGDVLVFIIDAMGSGLSASLTSICSTACLNFLFDLYEQEQRYDFDRLVKMFLQFSRTVLLKSEVLSCGFFQFRAGTNLADVVLFALPPVLVRYLDGTHVRVKGLNQPVSLSQSDYQSQQLDLTDVDSILIYTDGLSDAETADGDTYRTELPADFASSYFGRELEQLFDGKIPAKNDDTTFIRINRIDLQQGETMFVPLDSGRGLVGSVTAWLERNCIAMHPAMSAGCRLEIAAAVSGLLEYLCEHGVGGVPVAPPAGDGAGIRIDISDRVGGNGRSLLIVTITVSGAPLGVQVLAYAENTLSRESAHNAPEITAHFDSVLYNRQRDSLCLLKYVY